MFAIIFELNLENVIELSGIRARRCVNCFQHDFVVQKLIICNFITLGWYYKREDYATQSLLMSIIIRTSQTNN